MAFFGQRSWTKIIIFVINMLLIKVSPVSGVGNFDVSERTPLRGAMLPKAGSNSKKYCGLL